MAEVAAPATAAAPAPDEGAPESRNPFKNRDYAAWWTASFIAVMGVGIQAVTVPLFIRDRVGADERDATIAVALIVQQLPGALLVLIGGVIADRVERRLILMRAFSVAAIVSSAYVVLSAMDVTIIWPVFLLSAVVGSVNAFVQPARQSVIPQILKRAQLQNGVILGNMAFMAAMQFTGPALGGLVADGAGLTIAFAVEVGLLVAGVALYSRMGRYEPVAMGRRGLRHELGAGLSYVRSSSAILGLLALAAVPGFFFGGPLLVTMVGIVEDVHQASDKWVGILLGSFGAGTIVSSILLTARPLPRRGLLLSLAPVYGGVLFILFGLSESLPLSVFLLVMMGPPAAIFMNMAIALLQEQTTPEVMGRVMSVYTLTFISSAPLGAAQAGIVATLWGPQVVFIWSGAAVLAISLILMALLPVRRMR